MGARNDGGSGEQKPDHAVHSEKGTERDTPTHLVSAAPSAHENEPVKERDGGAAAACLSHGSSPDPLARRRVKLFERGERGRVGSFAAQVEEPPRHSHRGGLRGEATR